MAGDGFLEMDIFAGFLKELCSFLLKVFTKDHVFLSLSVD
jgi:hypothetical protein